MTIENNNKQRGKYGPSQKAWTKFLTKCGQYKQLPLDQWSEYHFLGYIMDRTGFEVSPVASEDDAPEGYAFEGSTEPNKHPQLRILRRIIAKLHDLGRMPKPKDWNRQKVKSYIDWCAQRRLGEVFSLNYWNKPEQYHKFTKAQSSTARKPDGKIARTDPLPANVIDITGRLNVRTYGDLAFYDLSGGNDLDWNLLEESGISKESLRKVV